MIRVKPFPGVRPVPDTVKAVVSPPYDVLDSSEARQMAKGNPHSFLHVSKPEIEFDPNMDPYDPQVYRRGKENIRRMMDTGVLIQDVAPCFYLYTLRMGDHTQTGLVAGASVDDYEQNRIRKHEHTRPEKEIDRAKIIDELDAQIEPVFLTYRATPAIDDLLGECLKQRPIYDFVADSGVQHTFRVIDRKQQIDAVQKAFLGIEALYVADGHHRSAAAARVCEKRRKESPVHTGEEPYNFFLSVIFPHSQLRILDYNRVVKDLGTMSVDEFLERIEREHFILNACDHSSGQGRGCGALETHTFGMYLRGRWHRLTARPGSFDDGDPIARLDVSILQDRLLSPLLGIRDPRTDKRIHFVGGIRGLGELERLVDSGQYAVAFALFPTSIEQLLEVADAGRVMPPKSTWFEPKLGSGIIIHIL